MSQIKSSEIKLSKFGPVPDFATDTTERVNRPDDCTDFFLRKQYTKKDQDNRSNDDTRAKVPIFLQKETHKKCIRKETDEG